MNHATRAESYWSLVLTHSLYEPYLLRGLHPGQVHPAVVVALLPGLNPGQSGRGHGADEGGGVVVVGKDEVPVGGEGGGTSNV